MEGPTTGARYPRILRRIQAVFIDGLVIPMAAIGSMVVLSYLGVQSGYVKAYVALGLIVSLEPLAVSVTGGSIGHHSVGMRVRRVRRDARISFPSAMVRFLVKTLTGLPAFLVVLTTKRRQALHDVLSGSIVVYKAEHSVPAREVLPELSREEEHRVYSSLGRRLLVIAAYWLLSYFVCSLTLLAVCGRTRCEAGGGVVALVMTAVFLLAIPTMAVLGWKGLLYGARKRLQMIRGSGR